MRKFISFCAATAALGVLLAAALRPPHPVLANSRAKNRGAELFATKGCVHCHGPAGVGGGKGPDLQLVRQRRDRASIITQIHDGGRVMPPFGDELTDKEIDDIAAFLRAKRKVLIPQSQSREHPAPAAAREPI